MGIIIGLISGILMSVQGVFNTKVTETTQIWVANSFVQATSLIVCLAAWFVTGRSSFAALMQVSPKYMLSGGIIGAFITFTVIKSMSSLGPAKAVMIIVTAQILAAYIIEMFGMFGVDKQPFEIRKIIGVILAVAGIWTFSWK